jgi:D-alanine-D-alanine ligase
MKKAIVIMGGPSAEHEVSLSTGREILKHLDTSKYMKRAVIISRDKKFFYCDTDVSMLNENDFADPKKSTHFKGPVAPAQSLDIWNGYDVVILGLHGEFGEDGRFQGFLETLDIPYTGSGVLASAMGMDKIVSKYLFEKEGITTPPYSVYRYNGSAVSLDGLIQKHGFPCYIKCPQSGSSRLMGRADSAEEFKKLVAEFKESCSELLIESNIAGTEYSCPVLEYPDGSLKPLPPILIRPVRSAYFDYTAKYTAGECEEITPAPCSPELTRRLQDAALKAHRAVKCRGVSRTDIIEKDTQLYVLEINTLPGMTSASLVPKSFAATGGTYTELLDILIETTLAGRAP